MKGKLKVIGLALFAALAVTALAVSSASAVKTAKFTASQYPAIISGSQEGPPTTGVNYFESTPGSKIECHVAEYEATLSAESSELTVTPHYATCGNTIDLNGCHFAFTAGTTTTETDVHGTAAVKCPGPIKQITITASGVCEIHIPEQTGINGITYTNEAGFITVDINSTNITAIETDTPIPSICPFTNHTTHVTNAKFVSSVKVSTFKHKGTKTTAAGETTPGTVDYTEGTAITGHVK
jgi:hypothetical protein